MIYNWIFVILVIGFGIWYFTAFNNRNNRQEREERREKREQHRMNEPVHHEAEEER